MHRVGGRNHTSHVRAGASRRSCGRSRRAFLHVSAVLGRQLSSSFPRGRASVTVQVSVVSLLAVLALPSRSTCLAVSTPQLRGVARFAALLVPRCPNTPAGFSTFHVYPLPASLA